MFVVRGLIDGRADEVEIAWHEPGARRIRAIGGDRGLVGDRDLVIRALLDEAERRTLRATPTGPFFQADLDNAEATLLQLTSYFRPYYTVRGEPPKIRASVPEGAIP